MAVCLKKGQKVSLTKNNPGLRKLHVGLGWDTNRYNGDLAFDLDAAVFMLTDTGHVGNDEDFIFFGHQEHASGSVKYMGDNRTGAGVGDDEVIKVDLSWVPANISRIAFTVTIYEGEERRQNFGQVENAFIRIEDEASGMEIVRYDLSEDSSIETAIVVGELYRHAGEWKFNAVGGGYEGGLEALCRAYGVNV